MWIVAGVLLGSMVLATVASLHVGPHGHGVAASLGIAAAVWLLVMIAAGRGRPLLFALLGADLAMSGGLGLLTWKGFTDAGRRGHRASSPEGKHGIAVNDIDPHGIVRVAGEEWTAESVNGRISAGQRVQVIHADGIRLQVWGEPADPLAELDLEPRTGRLATASPSHDAAQDARAQGAQEASGPVGPLGTESEAQH
jgi:membrane-bound ClpP family serine protease